MNGEDAANSRRRAFVIQFKVGTDVGNDRLLGRIEHVASGRAVHFESTAQLLDFVARVLTDLEDEPDGKILPGNNP